MARAEHAPAQWAVDEARRFPNGRVYEIDDEFGLSDRVPPEAVRGAWPVGPNGAINVDFVQPALPIRPRLSTVPHDLNWIPK